MVQYFLFDRPSAYQVERVIVRRVDYLRDEGADFLRNLWFPLGQLCVQFLGERIHKPNDATSMRLCRQCHDRAVGHLRHPRSTSSEEIVLIRVHSWLVICVVLGLNSPTHLLT